MKDCSTLTSVHSKVMSDSEIATERHVGAHDAHVGVRRRLYTSNHFDTVWSNAGRHLRKTIW